jgi:uncharacterized protein
VADIQKVDVSYFAGGVRLNGWFYPAATTPSPAIVFCPGFTGTKYAAFYQPYIKAFASNGISVLITDYRGWGDSEGQRGAIYPLEQVQDIRSGLTYLETRREVDSDRLGLFGVSFGAGHVCYVSGVDQRVKAGAAVSPVATGEELIRRSRREYEWVAFQRNLREELRRSTLTGESTKVDPTEDIMLSTPERRASTVKGPMVSMDKMPGLTPLDCAQAILDYRPLDVVERIAPGAILFFYVEEDGVCPPDLNALRLYEQARDPKRIVRFRGSSHYDLYVNESDRISQETLAWYQQYL